MIVGEPLVELGLGVLVEVGEDVQLREGGVVREHQRALGQCLLELVTRGEDLPHALDRRVVADVGGDPGRVLRVVDVVHPRRRVGDVLGTGGDHHRVATTASRPPRG